APVRIGGQGTSSTVAAGRRATIDFGGALTDVLHGQLPRLPREVEAARSRGERFLLVGEAEHHGNLGELLAGRALPVGGPGAAAPAAGGSVEVMEISYSGAKTLLLPLSRIDQVQKYGGIEGIAPKLDQLGGASWNKTQDRVRNSVKQLAINLLELYAQRQMAK